jgi:ribosomal protein S14
MKEENKILSPESWILETHPDPDNIHECNSHGCVDKREETYPIKEDAAYTLMQQYAKYYHKEKMKSLPGEKKKCPKCNSEHWYLRDQFDDIKMCRNCGNKF